MGKFVWIVWIVQTNYKSTKKYISTKVLITQPFFELQTPGFAWKFIWTVEPNDKVQKYKSIKQKSIKIQKRKKMQKIQKMPKCKKRKKHKKHKSTKKMQKNKKQYFANKSSH